MKQVFVVEAYWDNNEEWPEDRMDETYIMGIFETEEEAKKAVETIIDGAKKEYCISDVKRYEEYGRYCFTIYEEGLLGMKPSENFSITIYDVNIGEIIRDID